MIFFMQDPNISRPIICIIMGWLYILYITSCSHRKKWKKSRISFVYLHMKQMPWTCYTALLISARTDLKNIPAATEVKAVVPLLQPEKSREHLVLLWSGGQVLRAQSHAGWGRRGVQLHTCVNDTKQSRFTSGRKQTGSNQISYRWASAPFSHHTECVYRISQDNIFSFVFSENTSEIQHSYTFTYVRRRLLEYVYCVLRVSFLTIFKPLSNPAKKHVLRMFS